MKWEKLGCVFHADGQREWMSTHATVAIPEPVDGDLLRIYFSPRDARNRSHVAFLVIDIRQPTKVLDLSVVPALEPGPLGAFDHRGAMACWLVQHGGRRWLYYIGWTLDQDVPWRTSIGLAFADGTTSNPVFTRYSDGPIVDRWTVDPYFATSPCVLVEDNCWRMWYSSGIRWDRVGTRALPRYNIRYAESKDGLRWDRSGLVCIDHLHAGEVAIGRPCVVRDADVYRMWYSYRGDSFGYRMGYAESPDGLTWARLDNEAGLELSSKGWDSEMTAYPTVFDHGGRRYMLYCGNDYGRGGFGLAVAV